MGFVAVGDDRDLLGRLRHLRGGDVAQVQKLGEEAPVAGGKADAQARQARALRERVEHGDVGEVGPRRFQHPVRRLARVDFRVAFVGEDEKAVPPRERRKPRQISEIGDRALGIGG